MQTLTLRIKDIKNLNSIQQTLSKKDSLTVEQQYILSDFLEKLPLAKTLLSEKISLEETFDVQVLDVIELQETFLKWETLFSNLPGWDFCPICSIVDNDDIELLRKGVVIMAVFSPSYSYNVEHRGDGFELHLNENSTASFMLPTLADAEQYPELYNFKGSWKEAYLLLIATLQKGWPINEFPEELQKFLPKQ
ncbi:MAG TPA: hypothetical protein VHA56_13935 [Mucilaginibacter sp.]|nr:hypothetical protein [Mucilaginibacter sp.]